MKIAILSPMATVAPHFETELEIAQRHLDQGHEVDFLSCEDALGGCDFNADGRVTRCDECVGRRWMGIAQLSGRARQLAFSSIHKPADLPEDRLDSLANLCDLRIDEFDVGYAVVSSLVSIIRDPRPDLRAHRALIRRLFLAAWHTYRQTLEYCETKRPDRVYVFNGRFAAARAVLRACQARGVECWIHERGCDSHHFQTFVNRLPHDIGYMQDRIRQAWREAEKNADRAQIAATWFTDRVARVERNWHSFVKHQAHGRLPKDWDSSRRNITIFTSSEDEFVSIGESWRNALYESQLSALRRILGDLEQRTDRPHVYIRVHPNLRTVDNEYSRELLRISSPCATLIAPDDPTDSYELLRRSAAVVTFGSSIGIEAVYWERPSILLGPCFYQGFPGIYQPISHAEAITLLTQPLPPAADKTGALMYGYWFQTQGERFQYFQATGLFEGLFRGKSLYGLRRRSRWTRFWEGFQDWLRPAA